MGATSLGRHAWRTVVAEGVCEAYPRTIGRLPILFIVVAHFVEIVFVELAHKTGKVAVLEVLGEDMFRKLFVLSQN